MDQLASLAEDFRSEIRKVGSIWIVAPAVEHLAELMAFEGVAGAILQVRDDALAAAYPGRIGWIDWTLHEICMPDASAQCVISLFSRPEISLTVLKLMRQRGISKIGYFSIKTGRFHADLLPIAAFKRLVNAIYFRIFEEPLRVVRSPVIKNTESAEEKDWSIALGRITSQTTPLLPEKAFKASKIIIVSGSLAAGGSERQVTYTALGLRKRDLSPQIVCSDLEGSNAFFVPRLTEQGISAIQLPPMPGYFSRSRALLELNADIRSMVDGEDIFTDEIARYAALFLSERPGVVHAWLDWTNAAAGLAALAVGVPRIVLSGRSLSPTHFAFLRSFMRPAYQELLKSDRVVLLNNSRAGADDYASWIGVDPSRIKVIPNAIDPAEHPVPDPASVRAFRERYNLAEGTPVLGGVFRLMPEKRPDLWLKIAAEVAEVRPDARFMIVGGGPERASIEAYARQLGLGEKLILTGEASDVVTPLAVMSCFLLTSRVEGLPNVLLEAQLSGVPVVTSAVGGAPETIDSDDDTSLAIDGDDPAPYVRAVLAILGNPERLRQSKTTLPAIIGRKFGFDAMIDRTLGIYFDK
ncbi:MAG TPA: glycosyltransferase [Beijerinckiaceae bacterium]|nr:glycosyltransferase [Beijerinckiaceae bacterium]